MGDLNMYRPCDQRVHSWFEQTRTPFDPFVSMRCLQHRSVRCPSCNERCTVRKSLYLVPFQRTADLTLRTTAFMTRDGTGYLQRNFQYVCGCGLSITKSALALDKFAGDIVSDHHSGSDKPHRYVA